MDKLKAKLQVQTVSDDKTTVHLNVAPGTPEENNYAQGQVPWFNAQIATSHPDAQSFFEPGKTYNVEITPAG